VTAGALYLKPGTREWFMQWIAKNHPELAGRYRRLYGTGSYASKEYRTWLAAKVRYFKQRHGFTSGHGFSHRDLEDDPRSEEAQYPEGILPVSGQAGADSGHGAGGPALRQPTLF
jgi:hypothetical protein